MDDGADDDEVVEYGETPNIGLDEGSDV